MSEAMTNSEIEDVLSSIRRLVAQESRPQARPEAIQTDARPAPGPVADPLLLTAELRVGQANLTAPPTPRQPPSPVGAAQMAPQAVPVPPVSAQPVSAVSRVADLLAAGTAAQAPEPPVPDPVTTGSRADLEATITELEAALGPAPQLHGLTVDKPASAPDGDSAEPRTLSGPEPAGTDVEMHDAGVTRMDASPGPDHHEAEDTGGDIAMIDEADLQLLVARLVREELRGQLGERITQQVRKLVRTEIARALDDRNVLG